MVQMCCYVACCCMLWDMDSSASMCSLTRCVTCHAEPGCSGAPLLCPLLGSAGPHSLHQVQHGRITMRCCVYPRPRAPGHCEMRALHHVVGFQQSEFHNKPCVPAAGPTSCCGAPQTRHHPPGVKSCPPRDAGRPRPPPPLKLRVQAPDPCPCHRHASACPACMQMLSACMAG